VVRGFLGLFTVSREMAWGQEDIRWLRTLSDTIAYALERKLIEEALRNSEARFRTLIEKAPMAIGMARGGIHLYGNRKLLDMFGFETFDELCGRPVIHQWAAQCREMVADYARRRESGLPSPPEYVGTALRKDGSEFSAHVVVTEVHLTDGPASLAFLTDITDRVQAEESSRRSREQLRALSARLQTLREEERTRIAREIHDHLGQLLTALKLDLRSLQRKMAKVSQADLQQALAEKLALATGLADEMISSIQAIASELRPGILDRLGLAAAIEAETEAFQARTGISCDWVRPVELEISQDQTTAVFRVFQELLTNVARHARAKHVAVRLSRENDRLVLEVRDDGVGIKPSDLEHPKSLGLLGMRERAATLGGEIAFAANPGQGTTATLQIPRANAIGMER
jgi:PAS domain S-box-containing protein